MLVKVFNKLRTPMADNIHVSNILTSAVEGIERLSLSKAGCKDHAVTKPISLDSSTGEVLVRKSTGKAKIRKGQSEEEFDRQKSHFFKIEKGPVRTEIASKEKRDLLRKFDSSFDEDLSLKQTRQKLNSECHRLFFKKEYADCAKLCLRLIELYKSVGIKRIQKEIDELNYMLERSREKEPRVE